MGLWRFHCSMNAFVFVLLICSIVSVIAGAERPNIIVILADDLGWADLGCYGNTFNETPHIDALAKHGMRFSQFYAGPVCSPTRCNLQRGQDQARFGITQHIPGHKRPFAKLRDPVVPLQMPLEVETFAECAAKVGYKTGYFGKWHLGGAGFGPHEQGWQTALECNGSTQRPEGTGSAGTRRTAEFLTEKAVNFIAAHRESPFLLQVSHAAVHIPLSTKSQLQAKYDKKTAMPGYPCNPTYAGLLEELDQSVGGIVKAVDDAGIAEKTLILFLSDNGGLEHEQSGTVVTSNLPLRSEKGTLYEGGIRIPAIARWPGQIPSESLCEQPRITMDVFPTVLELTGGTSAGQSQDGVSLMPALKSPTVAIPRQSLYWHLPHYHHSSPASAIREGNCKLIEFYEGGVELYDLEKDPGERTNLAAHESSRVAALSASLKAWLKKVNARMPVPNPDYDSGRADELGKRRKK